MDIYQKRKVRNLLLFLIFAIGVGLQIFGHRNEGVKGLIVQIVSLAFLLVVLYFYNRQYENLTIISLVLIVLIVLTILAYFNI